MKANPHSELERLMFFQPLGDTADAKNQVRDCLKILRSMRVRDSENKDLSERLVFTIAGVAGLEGVKFVLKSMRGKTIVEALVPLLRGTRADGNILTRPDLEDLTGQS